MHSTNSRRIRAVLAFGALLAIAAAVAMAAVIMPTDRQTTPSSATGSTDPLPHQALTDGPVFGFVSLGSTPDDDRVVVGIDVAELLAGPDAHDAAVAAGAITDDENLPDDIFVIDDEHELRMSALRADAVVTLQGSVDGGPIETITVGPESLYDVTAGTYADAALYGIIPGEPLPMILMIERGFVVSAEQVYLP